MINSLVQLLERVGISPRRVFQAAVFGFCFALLAVLLTGFDEGGGFTLAVGSGFLALLLLLLWDLLQRKMQRRAARKADEEESS